MTDKFLTLLESTKSKTVKAAMKNTSKSKFIDKDDLATFNKLVTAKQYAKEHARFMKLKQKS